MPEVIEQSDLCEECGQPFRFFGKEGCTLHKEYEDKHGRPMDEIVNSQNIATDETVDGPQMEIGPSFERKTVIVTFSETLKWFELDPDDAISIAELLIKNGRRLGAKRPLMLVPE